MAIRHVRFRSRDPYHGLSTLSFRGGSLIVAEGQSADLTDEEIAEHSAEAIFTDVAAQTPSSSGSGVDLGLDWIEFAGHSLAAGGGARIFPWGGYTWRTKGALGIKKAHDYSIGGAIACRPTAVATGDGGYPWILRNVLRPGTQGVTAASGPPYNPQSQAAIVHFGLNDLGILGATTPLPFQTALRTILARFCAASVFEGGAGPAEAASAQWAYTGTWADVGVSDAAATCSGSGIHYTLTVGDKATFTVPVDYPAGRVIGIGLWVNSTYGALTYGIKIDGVSQPDFVFTGTQITDQTLANQHIVNTLRIGTGITGDPYGAPLSAGTHTIELTLKSGPALAIDTAHIEADPADGPLLICPLTNRPAHYGIWTSWPGFASMNDAAVDAWKDYERTVLAEFPGRVVSDAHGLGIDLDDAALVRTTDGTGDFVVDGAHPNERGHGKWTEQVARIVRNSPLLTDRIRSRPFVDARPRAWKQVGKVNSAGAYATGWSAIATAGLYDLQWRIDEERRVYIRGAAKSAAGAPTNPIVNTNSLPKPSAVASRQANRFDGTATWTVIPFRIPATGVANFAGTVLTGAGNFTEFDCDYQAEL